MSVTHEVDEKVAKKSAEALKKLEAMSYEQVRDELLKHPEVSPKMKVLLREVVSPHGPSGPRKKLLVAALVDHKRRAGEAVDMPRPYTDESW